MGNDVSLERAGVPERFGIVLSILRQPPYVVTAACALALLAYWTLAGTTPAIVTHLWKWFPALLGGLLVNIEISVLAMLLGTLVGLVVGAVSLSPVGTIRGATRWYVLFFRNSPILILIYFTTYVFPFEISVYSWVFPFPDWIKVVIGLGLPASANVAEIFRGAIQSIPSAQWESAQSLGFSRAQIFRIVVLPQCVRRMLPSWMNLYAGITMSTSLASLVGVHDVVEMATVASNTVARTDFTILIYFTLLALFFAYCYPIARMTRSLERRYDHQ